jgi:hypothetical protein
VPDPVDRQELFKAEEIQDVIVDCDLAAELQPKATVSQPWAGAERSSALSSFYIFCPDVFCRRCGQLAVFLVKSVFKDLS